MQERKPKVLRFPTSSFLAHEIPRGISLKLRTKPENLLVGENSGDTED